mgnify:CR=1 FL=1
MFCRNCGAEISESADVCLKCGKMQKDVANNGQQVVVVASEEKLSDKKRAVAGLLALFFGWIGAHNIYVGKVGVAIGQIALSCLIIICPFLFGGLGENSGTVEMTIMGFFGGCLLSMCLFVALFFWVLIEMICCFAGVYRDKNNKKLS